MRVFLSCIALLIGAVPAHAQEALGLSAPPAVAESGLLKHILPRFSLKTGIRVVADPDGVLEIADAPPGSPVFQGDGVTYFLRAPDDPRAQRFADWMQSEIGKRTIDSFAPDGTAPFTAAIVVTEETEAPLFTGDVARGETLSLSLCGRCHVIGPQNRLDGIGSTPSFSVLRTLPDWDNRFQQFYVLRPHGAFTQVADVTPPFDPARPSPVAPIDMTLDDLDAILAFVAVIKAADLGAPLQLQ